MPDPSSSQLASGQSSLASTVVSFTAQAAGTLLTLHVASDDYRTGIPSGWSALTEQQTFLGENFFYKFASGSETSVTYVIGSASRSAYTLLAHTNVDSTAGLDSSTGGIQQSSTGTYTTGAGTTSGSGRKFAIMAVGCMHGSNLFTGMSGWTGGYTEQGDAFSTTTPGENIAVATQAFDGPLAPPATTVTLSNTAQAKAYQVASFTVSSGGASLSGSPADNVGITDAIVKEIGKAPTDPVGITDAVTKEFGRSAADPVGISDSVQAVLGASATVNDPVGITDAVSSVSDLVRSLGDPVGITDSITPVVGFNRAPADNVGISDSVAVTRSIVITIADGIGIADVAGGGAFMNVNINDGVGIHDTDNPIVLDVSDQKDDPVGITDLISLVRSITKTVGDSVGITDSVSYSLGGIQSKADNVSISDTVSVTWIRNVTIADAVGITDSASDVEGNPPSGVAYVIIGGVKKVVTGIWVISGGAKKTTTVWVVDDSELK